MRVPDDSMASPDVKVSVVCTFYNIQDCVSCCLDTLTAQDFAHPYEIVCVDDGSTDTTGEILDDHAKRDERVHVIHQSHKGVSAARNRGVLEARAPFLTFVDGDDIVSPHYLSILYEALEERTDVLVRGTFTRGTLESVLQTTWSDHATDIVIYNRHEALRALMLDHFAVAIWGCMASRDLYLTHPLQEGIIFEDHHIMPEHINASNKVVFVKTPTYGYVDRQGSITHPSTADPALPLGMYEATRNIIRLSEEWPNELMPYVHWGVSVRNALIISFSTGLASDATIHRICDECSRYTRAHFLEMSTFWRREHLSFGQYQKILFAALGPRAYWMTRKLVRRLTGADA